MDYSEQVAGKPCAAAAAQSQRLSWQVLSALRKAVGASGALATVQWGLKVENEWEANLKENARRVGEAKPLGTLRGLDEVDWVLIAEQVNSGL